MRFHVVLIGCVLAGCAALQTSIVLQNIALIAPDGKEIVLSVEIADTPDEQARGLMDRPAVSHGMLFVFPEEAERTFWMKNTLVSLAIFFFDADGEFVSSALMEPCEEEPCAQYPSKESAMYALEFPAGSEPRIGSGWRLLGVR